MAEGIQLASMNSRYFCYHCDREVSLLRSAELTCPECSSGFLEEVSNDTDDQDYDDESDIDESDLNMLNLFSIENLFHRTVVNVVGEIESPRHLPRESSEEEYGSEDTSNSTGPREELHFPLRLIQELEDNLIHGPRTRLRYVGDYLFGDDIDALSTLLLNEAEIVGPPPLPKSQIKLLPVIVISREHVDKGIQCTICMEDFAIREKAKNLPCDHFYHEKCITPWLERHATCPNCRNAVEVAEAPSKNRRSQSCPRSEYSSRSTDQRRSSESTSVSGFFTASKMCKENQPGTRTSYLSVTQCQDGYSIHN